jgi:hypothetical protein
MMSMSELHIGKLEASIVAYKYLYMCFSHCSKVSGRKIILMCLTFC